MKMNIVTQKNVITILVKQFFMKGISKIFFSYCELCKHEIINFVWDHLNLKIIKKSYCLQNLQYLFLLFLDILKKKEKFIYFVNVPFGFLKILSHLVSWSIKSNFLS